MERKIIRAIYVAILWIILIGLLSSCTSSLYQRAGRSVVTDKYRNFVSGYYIEVQRKTIKRVYRVRFLEYRAYQIGDTIRIKDY